MPAIAPIARVTGLRFRTATQQMARKREQFRSLTGVFLVIFLEALSEFVPACVLHCKPDCIFRPLKHTILSQHFATVANDVGKEREKRARPQ